MDSIEKVAKNVDEAIAEALREMDVQRDDVEITVLAQGSSGFLLGFGAKPARVLVTKIFDPEKIAKTFLRDIAVCMGIAVEIETHLKEKKLLINVVSENMGVLIGKHGQTLDSLQYLVNLAINKGNAPFIHVILDTGNYRKRRQETLESLARNLAKKVRATGKNIVLEPMSSTERCIIHSTLQNDKFVHTYSEGETPYRSVVVALKNK